MPSLSLSLNLSSSQNVLDPPSTSLALSLSIEHLRTICIACLLRADLDGHSHCSFKSEVPAASPVAPVIQASAVARAISCMAAPARFEPTCDASRARARPTRNENLATPSHRFQCFESRFREVPRDFDLPFIEHVYNKSRPVALVTLPGDQVEGDPRGMLDRGVGMPQPTTESSTGTGERPADDGILDRDEELPSRRRDPRQGWGNCKPTTKSSTRI